MRHPFAGLVSLLAAGCGLTVLPPLPSGGSPPPLGPPAGGSFVCAAPHVLVPIADSRTGGRVVRLAASGPPCRDLTAQGFLPQAPSAVAALDADHVAVAAADAVYVIDANHDVLAWSARAAESSLQVLDLLPLSSPEGSPLVAAAFEWPPDPVAAVLLYAWDLRGQVAQRFELTRAPFPSTHELIAVTANPWRSTSLVTLHAIGAREGAAVPWDPFDARRLDPPLASYPAGADLRSLACAGRRLAWVHRPRTGGADGVHFAYSTAPSVTAVPSGPVRCADRDCSFLDAVPDPSHPDASLAICADARGVKSVVRLWHTPSRACDLLLDEQSLGPDARLTRLASSERCGG